MEQRENTKVFYEPRTDPDEVIGRSPSVQHADPEDVTTFLSLEKNLALYADDKVIKFSNRVFITADKEEKKQIRESGALGKSVWENEYPKWVKKKMKLDASYVESDESQFEVADRGDL